MEVIPPRKQFPVRLPVALLEQVDARAKSKGVSRNEIITRMLTWAVASA